jgi:hypothetical protein
MSRLITLRRTATPGKIPTTADMQLGELAINTHDGKVYLKKNVNGAETIVTLGETGGAGSQGAQGATGPSGGPGTIGAQGSTGDPGPQGTVGPQGNQGPTGFQGNQGPTGPQGLQGIMGPQGNQGPTGLQGAKGDQGFQGLKGDKGDQGFNGITGVQGDLGHQGNQGPIGFQGNQGPTGIQGTTGQQGNQGPTGFQGNQGPLGPQGNTGAQGNQGPTGFQGNQGPLGFQGAKGDQGNQGPTGLQGNQGPLGFQGNQGFQGFQGPQGYQGNQGGGGISAGQVYYFNKSQSSDISPYKVLSITPTSSSEQTTITSTNGNTPVLVNQFLTPELGFSIIPGGTQRFHLHFLKDSQGSNINAYVTIQLANSSGTSIGPLITSGIASIGWLNSSNTVETLVDIVLPSTVIDPTNRMIVKIYVVDQAQGSHNVTWYTEGTSSYSYVLTSVGATVGSQGPQGDQGNQGDQGAQGNQGLSASMFKYMQHVDSTVMANPGGGNYRFNNLTTGSVTQVVISNTLGMDSINTIIMSANKNSVIKFFNPNFTIYAYFKLTSAPSQQTGYVLLDGTMISSGGMFSTGLITDVNIDFAGDIGVQGFQGNQGPTGLQGTAGTNGSNGAQGNQGPTGLQGTAGTNGSNGAQGNQGPTGIQGTVGTTGFQGNQGPTGLQGNTGTNGSNGAQGNQGPTGLQGTAGTNGTNGTNGAQGNQGPTGLQGTAGTNGTNGTNGAQGNQGPTGLQGTTGAASTVAGPQGSTGAASTVAGPQGLTGPQGNTGPQGIAGPQGNTGAASTVAGPQGNTGAASTVAGPQGAKGDQGFTGPQGGTAGTATNLYGAGGSYIQRSTSGTSYSTAYQIRETNGYSGNTSIDGAPLLGFHWSGVVASSIRINASGEIQIVNNPGTAYEAFRAGAITATGNISGANLSGTNTGDQTTITGNAATATNSSQLNGLTKVQLWNNSGQGHATYQTFGAIPNFGVWFMQNSAAGDSPEGGSQYYVQTQGLGNDYGYGATPGNYGLMTAVARDHTLKYTYYRKLENGSWGGWTKAAAGYADTAGSATSASSVTGFSGTHSGTSSGTNTGDQTNISGNAATATNVAWSGVTSKPASWLNETNLIYDNEPNTSVPSGFWQNYAGANNPTGTWMNYINVRHSNPANVHGYQLGMSYYDNNLWFRSYSGGGTYLAWSRALGTNTDPYPSNMNQYVRTTDAPTFAGLNLTDIITIKSNSTPSGARTFNADSILRLQNGNSNNYLEFRARADAANYYGILFTDNNVGGYIAFRSYIGSGANNGYNGDYMVYGAYTDHIFQAGSSESVDGKTEVFRISANGNVTATGDVTAYSDARVKENIFTIDNALEKTLALRGVYYNRTDKDDKSQKVGVIAQEVLKVLPEVVNGSEDNIYSVAYGNMAGLFIEAIKELNNKIEKLEAQLASK